MIKLKGRTLFAGRKVWLSALVLGFVALAVANTPSSSANHPVYVEGNCNPFQLFVTPGSCGDYDGDGRVSAAEDGDNATDRIFGSINAALGFTIVDPTLLATTINQNGTIIIVSSGRFAEGLDITGGNVEIAAAPGVEANIDAVIQGDPDPNGSTNRQNRAGIIVDTPASVIVTLRNLTVRNWIEGIRMNGTSRVVMEDVRFRNNRNFGIHVRDTSRLSGQNVSVVATGYRINPAVDNVPNDGSGIRVHAGAQLNLADSYIMANFGRAISVAGGTPFLVRVTCMDNGIGANGVDSACVGVSATPAAPLTDEVDGFNPGGGR